MISNLPKIQDEEYSLLANLFTSKIMKKKSSLKFAYDRNKDKKPRRNKSAFIIFSGIAREKLKEVNGGQLNSNETMIKLADMWKNLPEEERRFYKEEALKDKKRYHQELENFWKENPFDLVENKTKANHVKKPPSAYAIFLKEAKDAVKQQQPGLKMADVLKILSEKWKNLDKQEKAKYQERAKKEKEISRSKLEEYHLKNDSKPESIMKKQKLRQKSVNKKVKKSGNQTYSVSTEAYIDEPQEIQSKSTTSFDNLFDFEFPQLELNYNVTEDFSTIGSNPQNNIFTGSENQLKLAPIQQEPLHMEQLSIPQPQANLKSAPPLSGQPTEDSINFGDQLHDLIEMPAFARVESNLDFSSFEAKKDSFALFGTDSLHLNSMKLSSLLDSLYLPSDDQKPSRGGILNDTIANALLSHSLNTENHVKAPEENSGVIPLIYHLTLLKSMEG